jgi:zinc D-Ala-D-Ala carboxypeptidase
MILTQHFSWDEVTFSEAAARLGIDNMPPEAFHDNISRQARLMEAVREILGQPIQVTSWYRCAEVNRAIGGAVLSAHQNGIATDFVCRAFGNPLGVCLALQPHLNELGVDQLIHEFGRWVHIGLPVSGPPRYQVLTARKQDGSTVYSKTLEAI